VNTGVCKLQRGNTACNPASDNKYITFDIFLHGLSDKKVHHSHLNRAGMTIKKINLPPME
jgi:hypothetical protein